MSPRPVLREVTAGLAGFILFMAASAILFHIAGYDPYSEVSRSFQITSIAYGVVFALISGYVTALLSPLSRVRPALMVALLIAVVAILSMLATDAVEAWSQLAALILMAPAVVFGSILRHRQTDARTERKHGE